MAAMKDRRPLTPEEKEAAARLKKIYAQKKKEWKAQGRKLTYEVIAEYMEFTTAGAVGQYMNANIPMNLKTVAKFARFFDVQPKAISPALAELLPNATELDSKKVNDASGTGKVPLISWVQAGAWHEVVDLYAVGDAEKWILCPVPHSETTFALTVVGQSMHNPGERLSFDDGDIIHVDPEVPAENNSLVVVRVNSDNEATFKQLIIEAGRYYLKALNPNWPDRIFKMPEDSVICGVVISKTVSYR